MVGDEDREGHVGAGGRTRMLVDALRAAMAANGGKGFDGHAGS